jgi:hypothetical protein
MLLDKADGAAGGRGRRGLAPSGVGGILSESKGLDGLFVVVVLGSTGVVEVVIMGSFKLSYT